jgi:uncharacterized protein YxjI
MGHPLNVIQPVHGRIALVILVNDTALDITWSFTTMDARGKSIYLLSKPLMSTLGLSNITGCRKL